MHRPTIELYDREAQRYRERRDAAEAPAAAWIRDQASPGLAVLDAGCGPGLFFDALGSNVVGLDASRSMLTTARREAGRSVPMVQADLSALPLRPGSLGAVWARQSYLHLPQAALPAALADVHAATALGAPLHLQMLRGPGDGWVPPEDDFPGRFFAGWHPDALARVVGGAGFRVEDLEARRWKLIVRARRERTLPDAVGPGMRVLFCGLNPSLHAADAGFGYAGSSNRFWPAIDVVGLTSHLRSPRRALDADGVGMTDLVKRATPRAADLKASEFREGADRVRALVAWLEPGAVCFVGLTGYRAAVDRSAGTGWQDLQFGGVPTYVMPSTSGLNTHVTFADVVAHLRVVEEETR